MRDASEEEETARDPALRPDAGIQRIGVDHAKEEDESARRWFHAVASRLGLDQATLHRELNLDCRGRSHKQPPGENACQALREAVDEAVRSDGMSPGKVWEMLADRLESLSEG